ncbi:hypothetical protein E3P89_02467 [Wallemia ichthyophaga]|uniref:Thioredoxin domain-containing protein n=2 Tax=Wallemia ichthyophaga TaxID=245174 RepID=A0A4T0EBD1_WALIC|nr:uncharacterized protein J056_001787 [Wallemia ichthyophaga EXF-994]TIA71380.1 hypothetical protein E3P91_02598 [Wallemia ichthyophaga]EOQ99464.1 hypothetical protein J056_001787 [Wallemia ichthyophaga EXF-994]TIA80966.1 hypothetical protein E3P98_02401 [Wallemia ichthyophaga]TIA89962.1 hypothetical protein E3P97_02787 [Wallemia ichthyophaga]TIA98670.1 hypothetical protein E3P95_02367 [Wallemia ichthyophaga]
MNNLLRPVRRFSTSIYRQTIHNDLNIINQNRNKVLLLDFTAEWCPPCKLLGPLLENVSQSETSKVDLIKIDVDENIPLAQKYGVSSMPTVIAVKNGEPVSKFVGAINKNQLDEFVNHVSA